MLLYVGIAIAGFFIVYFIKQVIQPAKQSATMRITPSISKATEITPPTGWKTYQNKENHLSLAYPPEQTIKTTSHGLGITSIEIRTKENTNPANTADVQILFTPKLIAQAAGQDFGKYYTMPDKTTISITSPLAQDATKETFTKVRNRTIQNYRAFEYRSIPSDAKPDDEAEIGVFIEAGDTLILISTGESNRKELEQLVTTLKYQS